MDPSLLPLPPINNNTVGSINVAVELCDLDNSPSAIAVSVADDFFALPSARAVDCMMGFLVREAPINWKKYGQVVVKVISTISSWRVAG